MGLLSDAAALARGRFVAVVLTAALPLVPAFLVAGGVVFVAAARVEQQLGTATRGEAFAERSSELPPDAPAEQRRDILLQAREPGAPRPMSASVTFVAGAVFAALVVFAGLFLAQGALLQLAAGASGSAAAWAAVGARFRPLAATGGAALVTVAIGCAACIVPGLVAALAFSLAAPVAVAEAIGGFPALQRSWTLVRRAWPAQLGLFVVAAVPTVLLTQGLGRLLPARAVLSHAGLDAAVAVVILPFPVFASAVLYLRERARAERKMVEELRQYILRMSAPG